jgi:hypothetical protein
MHREPPLAHSLIERQVTQATGTQGIGEPNQDVVDLGQWHTDAS